MLYKLVDSSSFFNEDEVQVSLLNLKDYSSLGMEKTAADDRISTYVREMLVPQPDKFYLHINAMGAGEYYGSNKNADFFPEEQLKKYHKTFEETGYVYRHHINKDPAKSMGRVIFSIYNERMHRVELIAELDRVKAKDIYDRILGGDFPKTSMACRTPWDICSICNNKAQTPQKYCSHIKNEPNKIMSDGRRVMAMNLAPLRFFDISIVIKPADSTSSVLQKVASAREPLSTEMAEYEGLDSSTYPGFAETNKQFIKQAALKKMSELIKKIDSGQVLKLLPTQSALLEDLSGVDNKEEILKVFSSVPLEQSLNVFAEVGIVPSISFLANLIGRSKLGAHLPEAFGHVAEDVVVNVPTHLVIGSAGDMLADIDEVPADGFLLKFLRDRPETSMLKQAMAQHGLYDGYVDTTAHYPKQYYTSHDKAEALASLKQEAIDNPNVFSLLLKIGGAALLAKFVISHLIVQKIDKMSKNKLKSDSMTKVAALVECSISRAYTNASKHVG